ncbi:MAG TPA: monovalent cation/H(+) antiporter subunit G [Jiangellales bacterium]|nr:monovalent cation/H(+) antiporter subunit G [Jiangellales bacterium]
MTVLDVASGVLLLAGSLFAVTGGVGLLRLPDFYTRTHAAGLMDSAGAVLILLGLLLRAPDLGSGVRLLLIVAFLLITGPTATHALAHAARNDGVRVWAERKDADR